MNPGCACFKCKADKALYWPVNDIGTYWTFMWHCARSAGWSEWFANGDELI